MAFVQRSLKLYADAISMRLAAALNMEKSTSRTSISNTDIQPILNMSELVRVLENRSGKNNRRLNSYEHWWITLNRITVNLRTGWANPTTSERIIPVTITGFLAADLNNKLLDRTNDSLRSNTLYTNVYDKAVRCGENILAELGEYLTLGFPTTQLESNLIISGDVNTPCVLENFTVQWGRVRIDQASNINLMKVVIEFSIRDTIRYPEGRKSPISPNSG